jgi:hypothetical protein
MEYSELLHVSKNDALNFFYIHLKEQADQTKVSCDETIYVATILASFAQTSVCEAFSLPTPQTLAEVFDNFILRAELLVDPELLELAGAQTLLLNGFFREQMRLRHNVRWWDICGKSFFARAAELSVSRRRQETFGQMAEHFPFWTQTTSKLQKDFYENRYLLRLN